MLSYAANLKNGAQLPRQQRVILAVHLVETGMTGQDAARQVTHREVGRSPIAPVTEGWKSRQELFAKLAARENLSIRQLYERVASARGHWTLVGTPEHIADQLEHWFKTGAADGFNVLAPTLPHGLKDFAELVIPELQRRGLFQKEYRGKTLRENLGLKRPAAGAWKVKPPAAAE